MNRRGLSLIELLVAVALMSVTVVAVSRTYLAGANYEANFVRDIEDRNGRVAFEDDLSRRISEADISGTDGYFISPVAVSGIEGNGGILGPGSASLVFTSVSPPPPAYVRSKSGDFETLNARFGARGGRGEMALSMTPVGNPGNLQGLFCREQFPADKEPTRGGRERLLDERIRDIRFEFSDGTQWLTTWDSREAQKGKLPVAVRVTYVLFKDSLPHQFLVRIPLGVSG